MNRNIVIILLIFLVPLAVYFGLTRDKNVTVLPSLATSGPEIIKFSSPMCYECQELEKIFETHSGSCGRTHRGVGYGCLCKHGKRRAGTDGDGHGDAHGGKLFRHRRRMRTRL